jgi:hypothetical protein
MAMILATPSAKDATMQFLVKGDARKRFASFFLCVAAARTFHRITSNNHHAANKGKAASAGGRSV